MDSLCGFPHQSRDKSKSSTRLCSPEKRQLNARGTLAVDRSVHPSSAGQAPQEPNHPPPSAVIVGWSASERRVAPSSVDSRAGEYVELDYKFIWPERKVYNYDKLIRQREGERERPAPGTTGPGGLLFIEGNLVWSISTGTRWNMSSVQ